MKSISYQEETGATERSLCPGGVHGAQLRLMVTTRGARGACWPKAASPQPLSMQQGDQTAQDVRGNPRFFQPGLRAFSLKPPTREASLWRLVVRLPRETVGILPSFLCFCSRTELGPSADTAKPGYLMSMGKDSYTGGRRSPSKGPWTEGKPRGLGGPP